MMRNTINNGEQSMGIPYIILLLYLPVVVNFMSLRGRNNNMIKEIKIPLLRNLQFLLQSSADGGGAIIGGFILASASLLTADAAVVVVKSTSTPAPSNDKLEAVAASGLPAWWAVCTAEMGDSNSAMDILVKWLVIVFLLTGAFVVITIHRANSLGKDNGGSRGNGTTHDCAESDSMEKKKTSVYHAHFDCFSGAAGDMMLASCIDASLSLSWSPYELLSKIEHDLKKGIPELENEFRLKCHKVWRGGMGSIAALKVEVESLYQHKPAPVPRDEAYKEDNMDGAQKEKCIHTNSDSHATAYCHKDDHDRNHEQSHHDGHSHEHLHEHSHEHLYHNAHDHSHDHSHDKSHDHSHEDTHNHSHEHSHDLSHGHNAHDHSHDKSHDHSHEDTHNHSHEHSHDHSHGHNSHNHSHEHHSHEHSHSHCHHHSSSCSSGPLRNLPQIKQMLLQSSEEFIPASVARLAIQTFTELAIAESFTHGASSPDSVHFHEVGAIDSIVDVVGTLLALHHLKVETVSCSRLPMGEGTVWTDHGQLPVPAFATMRLMMGMKTCPGPGNASHDGTTNGSVVTGELVTPTAAALLRVLTGAADAKHSQHSHTAVVRTGRPPSFTPRAVGLGAGTKDFVKFPNVVRLMIGDDLIPQDDSIIISYRDTQGNHMSNAIELIPKYMLVENTSKETYASKFNNVYNYRIKAERSQICTDQQIEWNMDFLTLLQANIDDIPAEVLSYAVDLLLMNGAIDAWVEPIVMKKGRSAHSLNCLYHSKSSDLGGKLMEIIFCHTTTLGIRIQHNIQRASLDRKLILVKTRYGDVNIKVGYMKGKAVSVKAEYEDCKKICMDTGIPIKIIAADAVQTLQQKEGSKT